MSNPDQNPFTERRAVPRPALGELHLPNDPEELRQFIAKTQHELDELTAHQTKAGFVESEATQILDSESILPQKTGEIQLLQPVLDAAKVKLAEMEKRGQ